MARVRRGVRRKDPAVPFTYSLLGLAIAFEVSGTLALRQTNGFTRLGPGIAVAVCYVLAFVMLSFVLKRGLPVAVAYALWSAAGILVIAVIGWLFLDERLSLLQVGGLALVVIGVVAVELGTHPAAPATAAALSVTAPVEHTLVAGGVRA
jgi:small multidrug resistance pump